jgi:hypothetical protein
MVLRVRETICPFWINLSPGLFFQRNRLKKNFFLKIPRIM